MWERESEWVGFIVCERERERDRQTEIISQYERDWKPVRKIKWESGSVRDSKRFVASVLEIDSQCEREREIGNQC